MIEVTVEDVVRAPIDAVWELVGDVDELGRWFAFADRFEVLSGSGAGRVQRMHGHWGKRSSEIDQEVTAYEPPRRLAWRHLAERLDGKPAPHFAASTDFAITLEPAGTQTLVRLVSRQVPASFLRGLVIRAFGRREVAQRLRESLAELAEVAPSRIGS